MPGQNRKNQNGTDQFRAPSGGGLKEFFVKPARKAGFGAAMMGAGLGLSGFGGLEDKRADAGIITSAAADPQAKASGAQYSVDGGGSVGYINNSAGRASGVYLGNGWVLTAGHVAASGGPLTFGTGSNFNSSPGTIFTPTQVVLHPQYSNTGNHDLALIRYAGLDLDRTIAFAITTPAAGVDILLAGYGTTGVFGGAYTGQDGFIRAGTSRLALGSALDIRGYSSQYFGGGFMRPSSSPNDIRAAGGDSGGGVFTQTNQLLGIIIAADGSTSGTGTYFLNTTNSENSAWIQSNITAVPEPSSFALLGAASTVAYALRRFRKRRTNQKTS